MARMPGAAWMPLPENATAPHITATQVILHSAVGSGSLYRFFRDSSNLESHFWVDESGRIEQYVDTGRRADANLDANARAISVETADNGHPDTFPWTPAQLDSLARIIAWAHAEHGIPIRRCPAWDKPGVGYHTMWGAPSHWTPVAKTCPGKIRIGQFPHVLDLAQETDMPLTDADAAKLWAADVIPVADTKWQAAGSLGAVLARQLVHGTAIALIDDKIDALGTGQLGQGKAIDILDGSLEQLAADVAAVRVLLDGLAVGSVDTSALAAQVADVLAQRLQS